MQALPVVVQRVNEFRSLPEGWFFTKGSIFSDSILLDASVIGELLTSYDFDHVGVFPGEKGEVQLLLERAKLILEFTLESDRTISVIVEYEEQEIDHLCLDNLDNFKLWLSTSFAVLWSSFVYSIPNTTTGMDVLAVSPSGITTGYPYSIKSVPKEIQVQFAYMPLDTIPVSQTALRSIGKSAPKISLHSHV